MRAPITSLAQLRQAMATDEREHLEFKSAEKSVASEDLFKYCVALANEGGGSLVLGVTDQPPRRIVGTDSFSELNKIKKRLLDTLRFRVDVFEISTPEGRVLSFFSPPRPIGRPRDYRGQYFMRAGESLVPMTPEVLERIFAEASPDYSQCVCDKATLNDLSSEAVCEFRRRWVRKSGNHMLTKTSDRQLLEDATLVEDGRITFAALVLLGKADSMRRLMPQAELIFEYRNSDSSIDYQDRVEYRAGFLLWADHIWKKINARNFTYAYQDGMFRYEVPAFNEEVVREALLNAIAHRDYRDGRSVFVRHFPNRLEITSPGGFPTGITPDNIIYRHHPRNRRIAEALQYCGLVERSGQGADRMFGVSIQEGKNRPDYSRSEEDQIHLILDGQVRDPRFVEYLDRLAEERNLRLALDDFLVLDRVRQGQAVASYHKPRLAALVDEGVIERSGRGRGVRYILSHALYRHVGQAGTYTRRKGLDEGHNQQLIIEHIRLCGTAGATISEFEQVLPNKTRPQINALLQRMKRSGRIRVEGRTKGARWHLGVGENSPRTIGSD